MWSMVIALCYITHFYHKRDNETYILCLLYSFDLIWFERWHWKFICNETVVWDFSLLVTVCLKLNNCSNVVHRNLLKSSIQQRQYFSRETRNFHGKLLIMEEGIFWPFSSNSAHLEHPERVKYCWLLDLSRFQGTGDKLPLQQWQTDPSFISWLLFSFGIILKAKVSLKKFTLEHCLMICT